MSSPHSELPVQCFCRRWFVILKYCKGCLRKERKKIKISKNCCYI